MRPGRRALFLLPRLSESPWPVFCQRLARIAQGGLVDETPSPRAPGRARLTVAREEDVHHARALCAEFAVLLVQPGAEALARDAGRPTLWLDTSRLQAIEAFDAAQGRMVVQAGCTLGDIRARAAGTSWRWHADGADTDSIGQWLARTRGWLPGRCADSGLESAQVLLADGAFEQLGPFGAASTQPLRSLASSRLVSDLFLLADDTAMPGLLQAAAWAPDYRLDALAPRPGATGAAPEPNPAHFLLGSQGSLAWAGRFRLRLRDQGVPPPVRAIQARDPALAGRETPADRLDAYVKSLFDSRGVFPGLVV